MLERADLICSYTVLSHAVQHLLTAAVDIQTDRHTWLITYYSLFRVFHAFQL